MIEPAETVQTRYPAVHPTYGPGMVLERYAFDTPGFVRFLPDANRTTHTWFEVKASALTRPVDFTGDLDEDRRTLAERCEED